ncbi:DctP family TRAP transporter solute-binding subunit [Brevibacillus nitrificans]|uniref:DctP family TRAP transporter solute-binding subunit n=1 Tax=Brevibacillus nitrificans TaxID=651560 RepID=UPI00260DD379|nr:DctP family TRAP transporter solute-binding subunit [Brevibacillus nitrificans]
MKSFASIALFVLLGLISAVVIGFGQDLSFAKWSYDEEQEKLSERIIIKFSHVVAENTPKGLAVDRFAQLVKAKTKGRVEVQVFPNSTLHSEKTEIPALVKGEIQMIAPAFSHLSGTIPQWAVLELPYVFRDQKDVDEAFRGEIGRMLFSTLNQSNMKGMAFWANGFKQITANRPMITPDDFYSQRIRIIPSEVLDAQFRTLHAIPIGSSFNDLYSMLASGKVDGEENTISNVYTKRLYQVQSHLTVSNHNYLGYVVIMNQSFWNKLPPDIQKAIEEALAEATRFNNELSVSMNESQFEKLKEMRVMEIHEQTEEERAMWRQALQPVYDQFAPSIGKPLMDQIKELHKLPR